MNYTDEELSAYLDGELDLKTAEELQKHMENNPKLAERIARLGAASEIVKNAYGPIIDEDIPQNIIDLVKDEAPNTNNIVEFQPKPANDFGKMSKWAVPIAAGFAMVFGVLVGRTMAVDNRTETRLLAQMSGVIDAGNPLYKVLETGPSASRVYFDNEELSVKPVLSFMADNGEFCREFQAQSTISAVRGLACRQDESWKILMLGKTEIKNENGYQTAAGYGDDLLDSLIDEIITGDVLDKKTEAKLISSGWQKTGK